MKKKTIAILIIAAAILVQPSICAAESDWEFYFFGINAKTLKNSNWLMLTAGAVTSMLAHELGHVLYLESQGKDYNLSASSSGLAVYTNNYLTDRQYRNFGRAGFAFQAGIGALLTSFESTRRSDFTKGWVSMNAAQIWTYDHRKHNNNDDFALIERGNGDKRLDFGVLAFISQNNLVAAASPSPIFYNMHAIENRNRTLPDWNYNITLYRNQAGPYALTPLKKTKKPSLSLNLPQTIESGGFAHRDYVLYQPQIPYLALAE